MAAASTTSWGVRKIGQTRCVRRFPDLPAAVLWSARANLGLFARGAAHRYEAVELPVPPSATRCHESIEKLPYPQARWALWRRQCKRMTRHPSGYCAHHRPFVPAAVNVGKV